MIHPRRMTARLEGEFCVFLIGMRINRPWRIHKWLPIGRDMPRMIAELKRNPELGLLHVEMWLGRTTLMVQYWRSFEQLVAYARDPNLAHLPAWGRFRKYVGDSGDVGIYHETYRIREGSYETIYHNMPAFGLGLAGRLFPIGGGYETAKERVESITPPERS